MNSGRTTVGERCYGIDIAGDGSVVVAANGADPAGALNRYAAGEVGASALREDLMRDSLHPRVCILSTGGAALALAFAILALPGTEVTLVAPRRIEPAGHAGSTAVPDGPEERARRLARLAAHLT